MSPYTCNENLCFSSVPRVAPMAIPNWKFMLKYFHCRKLNELLTRELYGIKNNNLQLHKMKNMQFMNIYTSKCIINAPYCVPV